MQGAFGPGSVTHKLSWLWPGRPPHSNSQVFILACSGSQGPRKPKGISSQKDREKGLALSFPKTVTTGIQSKPIICGWAILHTVRCPLIVPTQVSSVAWRCSLSLGGKPLGWEPPQSFRKQKPQTLSDMSAKRYSISLAQRNEGTEIQDHHTLKKKKNPKCGAGPTGLAA